MSKMISVASGFQYSVNIGYDLSSNEKLKNFIPTKSSLGLLEEILLSTAETSTERSRVLIGAYGKGKSHIVLTILSILMKRDLRLFEKLLPKLEEHPKLKQCVLNYYESPNKILPVVITGSNTSLSQAFLLALQRTLSDNDLLDVMPETNYKAAISVIERWEKDFPETYTAFEAAIDMPVAAFINALSTYDISAYEQFERVYPTLTAGSVFNPFLGFDVVELYESVAKGLMSKGFTGMYVVYDEFSKYLEANITEASLSDTKMLQDFAEKCNRSGKMQLHLMLISHKEIANYIDKLPKQKVDGWRGVSERFKHIHLNNNFSQTYEQLSYEMSKCVIKGKNGKYKLNKHGEILALKRARIVAGASEKLDALREEIRPYIHDNNILVYCGATNVLDENADYTSSDTGDIRQIEAVTRILGNEFGMDVAQFTSRENMETRAAIKEQFQRGDRLQAIVAIKCLDEGVNIPGIRTAFILASTTNPKEYIQRRGRVLRKAQNKPYAVIYDFVTLPRPLDSVSSLTTEQAQRDLTLVKNELARIKEFGRLSQNSMDANNLIWDIQEAYHITDEESEEGGFEYGTD